MASYFESRNLGLMGINMMCYFFGCLCVVWHFFVFIFRSLGSVWFILVNLVKLERLYRNQVYRWHSLKMVDEHVIIYAVVILESCLAHK